MEKARMKDRKRTPWKWHLGEQPMGLWIQYKVALWAQPNYASELNE
jgi:hypothetical protein